MRYALIGCGRIAANHMKAALNNNLELIAVCDIAAEKMEQLLSKHGLEQNTCVQKYTDYRQMLTECRPDLVAIATESGSHAQIALYCIEQGIHCIIEKPIAMSIADADAIIRLAETKNVKVSACHQNRFNLAVQEVKHAIEKGRFGKLSHGSVHVRWNRNEGYYEQAPWRGRWASDGGALMNQCIHGIDLIRWLMGDDAVEVYGQIRQRFHNYLEAEDVGVAIVSFRDGSLAMVEGTTNVYPQNLEESLCLFGETGTIKLGGTSANNIDIWDFKDSEAADKDRQGLREAASNVYGNGHTSLYADMIDAIAKDRPPYVDARAGRNALELVLAIYKSQKEEVPVKLPLTDFTSIDMSGLFN